MKIIICGFGSAGYAAAMSIRRNSPGADITVIDPKPADLMHPCGLPYALEGTVNPAGLLQDINTGRSGINRIQGIAELLSPAEKLVDIITPSGDMTEQYDSLVICSGSRPVIPDIDGITHCLDKSVFTLASVADLAAIREKAASAGRCAVIGGGAIGIEAAFAMKKLVKDVTVIEMKDQLLPGIIDPDISLLAEEHLAASGIEVLKGRTVSRIEGNDRTAVLHCGGIPVEAEIVILAAGSRPDTSLAEKSGISILSSGIKTDPFLRTSAPGVFAAGDCISSWSSVDGKPVTSRLATSAYKQGAIAGLNASGGNTEYRGTACAFVTRSGDFELAGAGMNTAEAVLRGFEPVSGKIKSKVRPEYYPDNSDVTVKIIFDRNSGVILGAQCAGREGAASRINIISMAIEFGITIDELGRIELAYCPAVSEVYDPLLRAADFGIRRFGR